jgi:hypothetical protein
MLEMTVAAPWSENEVLETNTFIPNFHAIAHTSSTLDDLMAATYRFTRSNPHWLPRLTTVYLSMLFYFRIFDCMVRSGYADSAIIILLDQIKSAFDFRRLHIPGPLVPFFQSLSLCSSGDNLVGDVCPVVPTEVPATSAHFWLLTNERYRYLPNILALLDYPTLLAAQATAVPDDQPLYHDQVIHNLHSVAVTAANGADMATAISGPGFHTPVYDDSTRQNDFRNSARNRLRLPLRIDQARVPNAQRNQPPTWSQFLRFSRLPGEQPNPHLRMWFGNLASMMSNYSDFFAQSCTLADIPVAAGASPHITLLYEPSTDDVSTPSNVARYVESADEPPVARHIKLPTLSSLACTAKLCTPGVPIEHIQLAVLSQTNARSATQDELLRTGDFWTIGRVRKSMTKFDDYQNTPSYVSGFHAETSIRRLN